MHDWVVIHQAIQAQLPNEDRLSATNIRISFSMADQRKPTGNEHNTEHQIFLENSSILISFLYVRLRQPEHTSDKC